MRAVIVWILIMAATLGLATWWTYRACLDELTPDRHRPDPQDKATALACALVCAVGATCAVGIISGVAMSIFGTVVA